MLQSRPFSYAHARPPEGKPFAAERLVHYHGATGQPADTAHVSATITALQAEPEHPSASLTADDIVKIGRGEMALPDHIRAAGPVRHRENLTPRITLLQTLAGTADAHNEALTAGLTQLGPASPKLTK